MDVVAIDAYLAAVGVVHPEQQAHEGGLAAAAGAHQRTAAASRHPQAHSLHDSTALSAYKSSTVLLSLFQPAIVLLLELIVLATEQPAAALRDSD